MTKHTLLCIASFFFFTNSWGQQAKIKGVTINSDARINGITLTWNDHLMSTKHSIYRLEDDGSWFLIATKYASDEYTYTDKNIEPNKEYTYLIQRESVDAILGYGLVTTGVQLEPKHHHGEIIVCYEKALLDSLEPLFTAYENQLTLEGWKVIRLTDNSLSLPNEVKDRIKKAATANTKALQIIGAVAVPYSGLIAPDGHNDHRGAWPTDLYYADLDGNWIDSFVNDNSARREANKNLPFDGKYDSSYLPSDLELMVARVYLDKMPLWDAVESRETRYKRYFEQNLKFRTAKYKPSTRALVHDNFRNEKEAFAANAYRFYSSICGSDQVFDGNYQTIFSEDYLFAYGCGPGLVQKSEFTECRDVAKTSDFLKDTAHVVFNVLFGSYFGDWDNNNNLLRAPLCNWQPSLTSIWIGRPNWFMNSFTLGYPIGYSLLATSNREIPVDVGLNDPFVFLRMVHVGIQGDLTLKAFHYPAVTSASSALNADSSLVTLSWLNPMDEAYSQYFIYRLNPKNDHYDLLTPTAISQTYFIDSFGLKGSNTYMIRAQKEVRNTAGHYFDLSEGILQQVDGVKPKVWTTNSELMQPEFSIFPNPSAQDLFLRINSNKQTNNLSYQITDMSGKILQVGNLFHQENVVHQLNLRDFEKGLYLITLRTDEWIKTKRFLKK